ncbi:hypothetical protein GN956_G7401 [Arapaima gigas]
MALSVGLLCVLLPTLALGLSINSSSNFYNCKKIIGLNVLEVLPGGGWDNLRNMDAGQVMNIDYTLCKTTEDGAYLLPDQVISVPQKFNKIEMTSDTVDNWLDYQSPTAFSINQDSSGHSLINGKFSVEIQKVKQHQTRNNSIISRIEMRNTVYTVKTKPSFTLDPVFQSRVTDIATALQNNDARMASFLSENLVLDYGTHVLTSIDAGGILGQEDYLNNSYSDRSSLYEYASILFYQKTGSILNYKYKETNKTSSLDYYIKNITYSILVSYGGMQIYPGMTLKEWEMSITNNLVAIDRSGVPLYFVFNQDTLPNLPEPIILGLRNAVSQAIELYYTVNTIPGCTNSSASNYNYQLNVNDNSCGVPEENLSFGGVFQQCTPLTLDNGASIWCKSLKQNNPITGNMSCGGSHNQTLLRTEIRKQNSIQYDCVKTCYSCWLIFTCCDDLCKNTFPVQSVRVETYWCSANNVSEQEPFATVFGGIYGPEIVNSFTNTRSCPPNYSPTTLLSDGQKICLAKISKETKASDTNSKNSVRFGGLFSCETANPMAGGIYHCPQGYIQQSAGISDGCAIYYCISKMNKTNDAPIQLPPYTRPSTLQVTAGSESIGCTGCLGKVLGLAMANTLWLLMRMS